MEQLTIFLVAGIQHVVPLFVKSLGENFKVGKKNISINVTIRN